jgi:hypothetical protein
MLFVLEFKRRVGFPSQKSAQQGAGSELLKLRFLQLVGAAMYLIIDGSCANPQSPQLGR